MIQAGLIVSRFVHFAALLTIFGVSLFPFYAFPVRSGVTEVLRLQRKFLLIGASIVFISAILWLEFTAAAMSGKIAGMTDPDVMWSVVRDTDFGRLWMVRLALALAILAFMARKPGGDRGIIVLLAGVLLASLASVGHAQLNDGVAGVVHAVADGLHLLAAGAWLGGLVALSIVLAQPTPLPDLDKLLLRFSGMGYIAVAVLVGSGLVNSWYLVGSPDDQMSTPYGKLLLFKLSLFALMVGIAVVNRLWIVPALARDGQTRPVRWSRRLRQHIFAEQALGFLIVAIVGLLGITEPAINSEPK